MSAWKRFGLVLGLTGAVAFTVAAEGGGPAFLVTPTVDRQSYLAHAVIWHDPGALPPDDIRAGRREYMPASIAGLQPGQSVECRYQSPGVQLGGKTPKFTCRTADGESLRFKYYDELHHGNREGFAEIAATRLAWALGFDVDPMFFVPVACLDCPSNPWTGEGPRAVRRYPAAYEPPCTVRRPRGPAKAPARSGVTPRRTSRTMSEPSSHRTRIRTRAGRSANS